ncbi:CDK-activating kinase assembly factor MAT1-like [Babylonia areolata]|uniref:CDK-activating kinase assembly factor MAT1-like n=1 Tax=Babylonia areolata TaxID=304850 RepID=UPI003FD2954A
MGEQGCPRCKTTKYRNAFLKMMVNVCGHSLCESCVDMLFIKGSGACPECGTPLRRNNYRLQVFEDAGVEKEVDIRRKILRDFNKKEEDFGSLLEYNDYLEMIETIIFNLTNGVEVESTRRMIEQYKKENKDIIKKNQSKLSRDDEYLVQLIDQQKMEAAARRQQLTEEEQREKALKRKHKDALIDDLMFSDKAAQDIVATHKQTTAPHEEEPSRQASSGPTVFSSGIRLGQQSVFSNTKPTEENRAYQYAPLELDPYGPSYPSMDNIMGKGYLRNVRGPVELELAGGFEPQIACQRALQDALCGLFHFPPIAQASPSPSSSSLSLEEGHSPMYLT